MPLFSKKPKYIEPGLQSFIVVRDLILEILELIIPTLEVVNLASCRRCHELVESAFLSHHVVLLYGILLMLHG